MQKHGASDLHLSSGSAPCLRIRGVLHPVRYEPLRSDTLLEWLSEVAPAPKMKVFMDSGDVDFAYELEQVGRYRANYFRQSNGVSAVFRAIPENILSIDDLGLPEICKRFAMLHKGLVLVTGPTGSGKTTTLAAMIDHANKMRRDHILTIEDPVEFKHHNYKSLVSHREIGVHTRSFSAALRGALREDPDIILIGEMRDLETITLALEAAATGHLVFGTLHTANAAKTVDRIIDVFPTDAQEQVRTTLAESLKGVIAQNLFRRISKGGGRVAALEILVGTPAVANLIREGKTHQLVSVIQTSRKLGMRMLDDSIEELVLAKSIDPAEAFDKCISKERFVGHLHTVPDEYRELLDRDGGRRRQVGSGR